MRWWLILGGMLTALLFAGCNEEEPAAEQQMIGIPVFRYDAVRDVVIASTVPRAFAPGAIAPQPYANTLAELPQVSYAPSPELRIADPRPQVQDGTLTVNYRGVAGLEQMASAQAMAVLAALEAWWWTPSIQQVRLQAAGEPVTTIGPLAVTQPLTRPFHTYIVQPQTNEVAYLVGGFNPPTLSEAVAALRRREIAELPATQGFQPLLPVNATITVAVDQLANGVLPVDLSADFPRRQTARLAGIVLMLTQYPGVQAVRFTFGGETVNETFMLGNVNAPITPYQLLLPVNVARLAAGQELQALQLAAEGKLGHTPAAIEAGLVWHEWAAVKLIPKEGEPPQLFLLKQQAQGYVVQTAGARVAVEQALAGGIPREAIIALRLPGWELLLQQSVIEPVP